MYLRVSKYTIHGTRYTIHDTRRVLKVKLWFRIKLSKEQLIFQIILLKSIGKFAFDQNNCNCANHLNRCH